MKLRSTVVKKLSANAPSPASMGWIGVNLELRLKWAGGVLPSAENYWERGCSDMCRGKSHNTPFKLQ